VLKVRVATAGSADGTDGSAAGSVADATDGSAAGSDGSTAASAAGFSVFAYWLQN
jgi:hypothetical protein